MPDLADFLLARISEDEHRLDLPDYEVVTNSHGQVSARGDGWVTRGDCPVCGAYQFDGTEAVTEEAWWDHAETVHQRARVLAECDAKRRIVERWQATATRLQVDLDQTQGEWTLQLLALPYAEHPEYDQRWTP